MEQLLQSAINVHENTDVMQTGKHTQESLVLQPSFVEV
jgi:hypothetical protein